MRGVAAGGRGAAVPVVLAAALALGGTGAVGAWWAQRPPADAGAPLTAAVAPTTTPGAGSGGSPPPPEPGPDLGVGVLPTATARPALAVATAEAAAPVVLVTERLGGEVEVVPVGATSTGAMEVPDDGDVVGWYRHGAAPGSARGSAVLAGHVDTYDEGAGALHRLRELEPGDRIEVGLDDGSRVAYTVTTRASVAKEGLPAADLFTDDGPPRLVLVTCGGRWLPRERSYTDNVVVVADAAA